jgi:phospholipid/cholesterol/gamma-HCH transport system substrate-binding protein
VIDVRDRRTERINRARLELELRRSLRPTTVVVLGLLVGLAAAAYIGVHVSRTLFAGTYEVRFAVDDATGVVAGLNEVRLKGVPVGTITRVDSVGGRPVLTAQVKKKYGPVYRDARAQLRPNTALQDMYLDIVDRGTPAARRADAAHPLAETQTATAVHIDDVLNVFRAGERDRLRTLLDNLGNGMRDRGATLRTAFVQVVPFLRVAGRISEQLARREAMTRRLVHNTAVLTSDLARRDGTLRTLVHDGAATLSTLQAGSHDLDATLRALPPTLATMDASFSSVRGVLGDVDGAVRALYPVAGRLPRSLASLRALNAAAAPAVHDLRAPVGRLVPFARAVVPVSAGLEQAVQALAPQTGTIDHVTGDLAACKKGVQGFFQWNASMSKFGDVRGPIPRGNVVFGGQSGGIASAPDEFAPKACTAGRPIGGRVPGPSDEH